MRGGRSGARGPTSLKPNPTRTERTYMRRVDGEKVTRLTPGDLLACRKASRAGKHGDAPAEVSRGHSSRFRTAAKGQT